MKLIELDPASVELLMDALVESRARGVTVRLAIDGDSIKLKVGEGMWSLPLGES